MSPSEIPLRTVSLLSDEACISIGQDQLGRAAMARELAGLLASHRGPAQAIAIRGPWGSGKTSVLNFVADVLKDRHIDVVRFSPWGIHDSTFLIWEFFRTIRRSQFATSNNEIFKAASKILHASAFGAGVVGQPLLMPILGGTAKVIEGLANQPSLAEARDQLSSVLKKLDRPLIVFIDDIDRLDPKSALETTKLIREIGWFPNLTYVVAYDQKALNEALAQAGVSKPREYLAKIFQLTVNLPPPTPQSLVNMLSAGLGDVMEGVQQSGLFDLYSVGIEPVLKTPRDIKQFVNGMRFGYLANADSLDVIDFAKLELIRMYRPAAYDAIASLQTFFAPSPNSLLPLTQKKAVERLAEHDIKQEDKILWRLVGSLFPFVASLKDDAKTTVHRGDPRWPRIGRSDCFTSYFSWEPSRDSISPHVLDRLVSGEVDEVVATLKEILDRGGKNGLLLRLRDFVDLKISQAVNLLSAIARVYPSVAPPREVFGDLFFRHVFFRFLSPFTETERADIFRQLLNSHIQPSGLEFVEILLSIFDPSQTSDSFDEDTWKELSASLVGQIRTALPELNATEMGRLIWFWYHHDKEDLRDVLTNARKSDTNKEFLLRLLDALSSPYANANSAGLRLSKKGLESIFGNETDTIILEVSELNTPLAKELSKRLKNDEPYQNL